MFSLVECGPTLAEAGRGLVQHLCYFSSRYLLEPDGGQRLKMSKQCPDNVPALDTFRYKVRLDGSHRRNTL
jgi:hypothetical protein